MTDPEAGALLLSTCTHCHARFLPRPGRCPRCGGAEVRPIALPAEGIVRAATALESPATGWPSPHRIGLVELAESVLLLVVFDGETPAVGDHVAVLRDGEVYRARSAASASGPGP